MFGDLSETRDDYASIDWPFYRDVRLRDGVEPKYDTPIWWMMKIPSYTLDEEVPEELGHRLLEHAPPGSRWNADLSSDEYDPTCDVASAILFVLLLGTPDALELRQRIWTPTST